ncbi:hypothetical protein TNCV_359051 [Trichonephila clavipes]|nr:hypothetical protein TNCV_359051 [Trichonephila clavipes]
MALSGSLPQINLGVQGVTQGGHHKCRPKSFNPFPFNMIHKKGLQFSTIHFHMLFTTLDSLGFLTLPDSAETTIALKLMYKRPLYFPWGAPV